MGFDLKDIADMLPFILENLPICAYMIMTSVILGFCMGMRVEKNRQKREKPKPEKILDLKKGQVEVKAKIELNYRS